ncbi:MAG: DUF1570 domain-containing protein, partial [Planctomycetota bacterium]
WWWVGLIAIGLAAPALGQGRQAQSPWWFRAAEREVGHYWVKTDLPTEEAGALARHLNLMYGEYAGRLSSLPARAPAPLNVLLFADREDYEDTLHARYGIDAAATGGMFFETASGTALALWTGGLSRRRVRHVLQHEGFHQFAYSRFGSDLPPWVNEGLAELFGMSVVVGGNLMVGQASAQVLDEIRSALELGTHVPFDRMLSMTSKQWSEALENNDAAGLYTQSWSMVHFLVYGDGGRYLERFERYLRLVNAGYRSRESFVRAFETEDFEAFERRWRQYIESVSPSSFVTALERLEFLAEGALALSRKGELPESLDELQEGLGAIEFALTLHGHAGTVELRSVGRMFTIPPTGASREGGYEPVFVVSRPKLHQLTRPQRVVEEARPTPSVIETMYLKPRDLAVKWTRGEDGESFTYDIVVR